MYELSFLPKVCSAMKIPGVSSFFFAIRFRMVPARPGMFITKEAYVEKIINKLIETENDSIYVQLIHYVAKKNDEDFVR